MFSRKNVVIMLILCLVLGPGMQVWCGEKDYFKSIFSQIPGPERRLPLWFDGERVQAHVGFPLKLVSEKRFFNVASSLKKMGATTYVRYIKSGDEGAWWPSGVGKMESIVKRLNVAKKVIADAHSNGSHIIVYYRHSEDAYVAKEHPDWLCRGPEGKTIQTPRGKFLCLNSPYRDFVLERLLELVDLGADGFYFDYTHMPRTGCWNTYCKEGFKAATGLEYPSKPDFRDRNWQKFVDYNNRLIEQTFLKWKKAVRKRRRGVPFIVSASTWPSMAERHTSSGLYQIVDSVKTEFLQPWNALKNSRLFRHTGGMALFEKDVKLALGFTLARDAAEGRPAHVWIHGLLTKESIEAAIAGVLTYGCIANLDIPPKTIPNARFTNAFSIGRKVSPHFIEAFPLSWVAIHYPEHARERYATTPQAVWKKVLYPFYGVFEALVRAHIPTGVITDTELEKGVPSVIRVLVLPSMVGMNWSMRESIAGFTERGGKVITLKEDEGWSDPAKKRDVELDFVKYLRRTAVPPLEVFGGTRKMHTGFFFKRSPADELIISMSNDFSWVKTGRRNKAKRKYVPAIKINKDVKIIVRDASSDLKAFEILSGKNLIVDKNRGTATINVPDFREMSFVVIKGLVK